MIQKQAKLADLRVCNMHTAIIRHGIKSCISLANGQPAISWWSLAIQQEGH